MPEWTDIRIFIGFQDSISGLTKSSILTSLLEAANKCPMELAGCVDDTAMMSSVSEATQSDVVKPAVKCPRLDVASPLDLLDAELWAKSSPSTGITAAEEVADYLCQDNIQRQLNPLEWWKMNAVKYPCVAEVARRYLSEPSTSVASKQPFSSTGDLYSDSRNHLSGHRVDMLLFIKHNLKHMCDYRARLIIHIIIELGLTF